MRIFSSLPATPQLQESKKIEEQFPAGDQLDKRHDLGAGKPAIRGSSSTINIMLASQTDSGKMPYV